ncbi:MAG: hypothetical protein P1P84_15045 [Deferrisomatales bacterium]|nr:hypothetical protein [Deferrisomatales bacterium]
MSRNTERALKAVLFGVIAAIVGATFYFAGPPLGVPIGGISLLLLWAVFVERTRRCPYQDDAVDMMVSHPAWKHWEGNIWHKRG